MDVVKSRLQADGVYLNKYKGILDCILQSYQNEGLKVSGIWSKICASGICFFNWEIQRLLQTHLQGWETTKAS